MTATRRRARPTEEEIDAIMPQAPQPVGDDPEEFLGPEEAPPFEVITGAGEKPMLARVSPPVDDDPDDETFVYNQSPRQQRQSGKVFSPNKHFRTLRGKGDGLYLDAKWRLVWVRSEFPNCEVRTELIKLDLTGPAKDKIAVFKATITLPDGAGVATGFGSETEADFKDFIEKAEKKAISRALDHLGYGTAAAEDDGERIADAPVEQRKQAARKTGRDPKTDDAPLWNGMEQEAKQANNKDGLGFPPVSWEGQKLTNMTQVRTAMFAALDTDNRRTLFKKIKATEGWENAWEEIKVYWGEANDFDSDMAPQEG